MSRIFICKPLVVALIVAFSSNTRADDLPNLSWKRSHLRCVPQNKPKINTTTVHNNNEEKLPENVTKITADKLAGKTKVSAVATGDVMVERNDETLNAQWIEYNQINDTIKAGDHYTLTRADGQIIHGKNLQYDLKNHSGNTQNAEFETEHEGKRLQGVSSNIVMHDKTHSSMHDVKFNTCDTGDHSWYIQASELTANRDTNIGVAKHARLVFGGVPILYTPWADFPLSGDRKSGFLVPTLKIGSNGTELETPYYINLAANRDATITPGIITARGATLGGQFRYLEPNYAGSITSKYIPSDRRSQHKNRYEVQWQHNHTFSNNFAGGIHLHHTSDDDYYRDFFGRNDIAENIHLDNKIWLTQNSNLAGGQLNTELMAQKYQTLSDSLGRKNKPYAIMPRISANWEKNQDTVQYNIAGQITRFENDNKQSGTRAILHPSIQWYFNKPWGYIQPKIGLHASQYWLDNFNTQPKRSISRTLFMANVDSGLTFERKTKILGQKYIQTFEPRLFYNYISSKAQNNLPNFDSSENAFSYNQLFRENVYSGNDRINSSNSLSIGLQTRFLDNQTGAERFRMGVGQKLYFNTDNILLDGNLTAQPRTRSDITLFSGGQIHPDWFVDVNWHYNQSNRKTQRFDTGIRYNPEAGKVLSARYKYGRNEEIYTGYYGKLKHIDLAAQYPISSNLYAVGRLNYSLSPFTNLEKTIGLEYRNQCGCWSMSVVGQRYITGLNQHKNAFYVTLQLKNLSSLGNNPYETLRLGIPGYHKTNEVTNKYETY